MILHRVSLVRCPENPRPATGLGFSPFGTAKRACILQAESHVFQARRERSRLAPLDSRPDTPLNRIDLRQHRHTGVERAKTATQTRYKTTEAFEEQLDGQHSQVDRSKPSRRGHYRAAAIDSTQE